eukprot:COSAG06_NODE_34049_length_480_cov_1.388451_1_plen_47_part_01
MVPLRLVDTAAPRSCSRSPTARCARARSAAAPAALLALALSHLARPA